MEFAVRADYFACFKSRSKTWTPVPRTRGWQSNPTLRYNNKLQSSHPGKYQLATAPDGRCKGSRRKLLGSARYFRGTDVGTAAVASTASAVRHNRIHDLDWPDRTNNLLLQTFCITNRAELAWLPIYAYRASPSSKRCDFVVLTRRFFNQKPTSWGFLSFLGT